MRNDKDDELKALYAECSMLRKQLVDAYSELSRVQRKFNDLRAALVKLWSDK